MLGALEQRLDQLAQSRETIGYGALARELGLRMGELTQALEALMTLDHAQSRPFRAALCTAKLTPGLPAPGFFEHAQALGRMLTPADIAAEQESLFRRAHSR